MRRIGILGLDTSHAPELIRFFNVEASPGAAMGRVVAAWAGGSPDVPLSIERVGKFTAEARDHGVEIFATPEGVAERCDALILLAMDGRCHADVFERVAPWCRPTFVNKPVATSVFDVHRIEAAAQKHSIRWFSASALRFLVGAPTVARTVHVSSPLWFEPANAGWFWYGIHGVELMQTAMGVGVISVRVDVTDGAETLIARWADSREARVEGLLSRDASFAWAVDGGESQIIPVTMAPVSQAIADFFAGGAAPVTPTQVVEVVRIIEAANVSRARGGVEIRL